MIVGYKVYFDKKVGKFVYDKELTEVQNTPSDSTTHWNASLKTTVSAVADSNNRLEDVKICKQCGTPFWQTADERHWFKWRGMNPPKRCLYCRGSNRDKNRV